MTKSTDYQLLTQKEATKESWIRFNKHRKREYGLYGHDMGIHDLNMALGGWIPEKVTTIAARSGMGKTAMTVPMFKAGARILNNRRAEFLFFTWEMGPSYLIDRDICATTGLTLRHLTQGARLLTDEQVNNITEAYAQAAKLPVTYQEFSVDIRTVEHLTYTFVEQCHAKEKLEGITIQPVVVVDYVGMAQFHDAGPRTYSIADFMNNMKRLCKLTGAAAVIFSQINRLSDTKEYPDVRDISDSQSIEAASDNVLILHRPEYYGIDVMVDPVTNKEIVSANKMLIRVCKCRDFGTRDFIINTDIARFRFWHTNHEYDYPYWELYSKPEFWKGELG